MHIALDLRCLPTDGSAGAGVAHAAREIAGELSRSVEIDWVWFVPRGALPPTAAQGSRVRIVELPHAGGSALRAALVANPVQKLLVLSGAVPPGLTVPTFPWVHDVAIFEHPEWFPQPFWKRALTTSAFRRGLGRAAGIFCVSPSTKDDLVRVLKLDAAKILVTHEGGDRVLAELSGDSLLTSKREAKERMIERGISPAFLLWMGTLEPRKNIPGLLLAWRDAHRASARVFDLVIAGRDGWKLEPIHRALRSVSASSPPGSHIHRVRAMDDAERRELLLAAELVVVPSWYEGFGLVALEAMQAGTTVVAAKRGGLTDVVGESGILLDPDDASEWPVALARLMADPEERRERAQAGKSRSQGLSWSRAAEIMLARLTETS